MTKCRSTKNIFHSDRKLGDNGDVENPENNEGLNNKEINGIMTNVLSICSVLTDRERQNDLVWTRRTIRHDQLISRRRNGAQVEKFTRAGALNFFTSNKHIIGFQNP